MTFEASQSRYVSVSNALLISLLICEQPPRNTAAASTTGINNICFTCNLSDKSTYREDRLTGLPPVDQFHRPLYSLADSIHYYQKSASKRTISGTRWATIARGATNIPIATNSIATAIACVRAEILPTAEPNS